MKRITKILSASLAMLMLAVAMVSCTPKTVGTSADGTAVPGTEYAIWSNIFAILANDSAKQYNVSLSEFLAEVQEGKTLAELIDGDIKSNFEQTYYIEKMSAFAQVSLTAEEKVSLESQYTSFLQETLGITTPQNLGKLVRRLGITEARFKEIMMYFFGMQTYASKIIEKLYDAETGTEKVTADNTGDLMKDYVRIKHTLIKVPKTKTGEDGTSKVNKTEDELAADLAAAKQTAEDYAAQIRSGTNIDDLMSHSQDPGSLQQPYGYVFKKDGSMTESFETAAFEMQMGEVRIVETQLSDDNGDFTGVHVMQKLDVFEDFTKVSDQVAEIRFEAAMLEKFAITYNEKSVKQLSITKTTPLTFS